MRELTILILSEAPQLTKCFPFCTSELIEDTLCPSPATAPGNVMFPVSPSAWQVHLVWVSLRAPGRASHSLSLPVPVTPLCLPHSSSYLLPADPPQNLKLLFLLQGQLNKASKAGGEKFSSLSVDLNANEQLNVFAISLLVFKGSPQQCHGPNKTPWTNGEFFHQPLLRWSPLKSEPCNLQIWLTRAGGPKAIRAKIGEISRLWRQKSVIFRVWWDRGESVSGLQ